MVGAGQPIICTLIPLLPYIGSIFGSVQTLPAALAADIALVGVLTTMYTVIPGAVTQAVSVGSLASGVTVAVISVVLTIFTLDTVTDPVSTPMLTCV